MSIQPLKEGERFVIRDLVYKVIRARINGKLTIKLKGIYTPRGPTGITPLTPMQQKEKQKSYTPPKVKPLTSEEKETEKKFFDICEELDEILEETNQEKEETKDAKKDDSRTREEPVPGKEGNNSPTTGSQLPRTDSDRPTFG